VEEGTNGRAIARGIRFDDLDPADLCDLIFYWIAENKNEAQAMKDRGLFEVPPKGYRGSLRGTSWDQDAMNADYFNNTTTVQAGAVA
jgi:hypothetical protein